MIFSKTFRDVSHALRLLVSVRDAGEADLALAAGADLIDAKDPERGALGALPPETVRAIAARVGNRALTSAVAGEPEPAALPAAVRAMAATGVDFVKVALRPGCPPEALTDAAGAAPGRLIAVLFAEDAPRAGAVPALAAAGLAGAMIDTASKDGRRLTDRLGPADLTAFTEACRAHGLLSGLAGSLRVSDIPSLAPHRPSYLGFRGGLCRARDRRLGLDPEALAEAVRTLRALPARAAA
ncbi:(5-formylfuran-3-yl)methyl phosphate synthase [Methylobacterium symbioticum]|nr:(5-formylfuran-3-yl)methyl phosphate synthase [uncultured Methylobacterium sp.]